ncbi:MAG: hypothetical protein LBM77_07355 [Spirochaetaceae bacterium]|nr:hypothetical protein [Spirochaetaceae bacterium]
MRDGGNIIIEGGTVTARGGYGAAGLGGGQYFTGGTITITGGTVTATGGGASLREGGNVSLGSAGIGGGTFACGGTISIQGDATVYALSGGRGAGIGGGNQARIGHYNSTPAGIIRIGTESGSSPTVVAIAMVSVKSGTQFYNGNSIGDGWGPNGDSTSKTGSVIIGGSGATPTVIANKAIGKQDGYFADGSLNSNPSGTTLSINSGVIFASSFENSDGTTYTVPALGGYNWLGSTTGATVVKDSGTTPYAEVYSIPDTSYDTPPTKASFEFPYGKITVTGTKPTVDLPTGWSWGS